MAIDLPTEFYHDPETFQRERRAIFSRRWHMLGRTDQLDAPGRYVCGNIGGYPLFALVDKDGAVAGYRNVCRHQLLPVLENGAGRCEEQIRCKYHGWTYGLDGVLILAPPTVKPDDFETATYRIETVPLEIVAGGLVMIHPGTPEETARAATAGLGLDRLSGVPAGAGRTISVNGNWKLVVDALLAGSSDRPASLWPWLFVEAGVGWAAIWQVVPRSFRKTELTLHPFGAVPDAVVARADAVKVEADAIQSSFDEGGGQRPRPGSTATDGFRERVADALSTEAAA